MNFTFCPNEEVLIEYNEAVLVHTTEGITAKGQREEEQNLEQGVTIPQQFSLRETTYVDSGSI